MAYALTRCIFLLMLAFQFLSITAWARAPVENLLNVQFSAEPSKFDPLMMEDGLALRLAANVIATPMEYDSKGKLQAALLETYHSNTVGDRFEFKFRANLKWSDGVPFHADQFLLALKRLSSSKVKVALAGLFPLIDFEKTKVLNERQITVVLVSPAPLFIQWCSLPPFAPIRHEMIDFYEKKHSPLVPTLGAYRVTKYFRDDHFDLEKNENFYGAAEVKVEKVHIYMMKDEIALLPLLKAKKIDILTKVPVLQDSMIKKIATVVRFPVGATTYIGLNTRAPPFDDKKNRQLFRNIIFENHSALTAALKTSEIPAKTFLPEVLFPDSMIYFELVKKMQTAVASVIDPSLKNQSYKFTLQSDQGSKNQTLLEFIQHLAKTKKGWALNLETLDWKEHLTRLKSISGADPAAYRLGWQNPVTDPFVFYQAIDSLSVNNFTGWKSVEYDQLVQKLKRVAVDADQLKERVKLITDLEEILYEEVPVIPVLHQVLSFAYSKRILGFRANPFGVILFREIRFNEKLI